MDVTAHSIACYIQYTFESPHRFNKDFPFGLQSEVYYETPSQYVGALGPCKLCSAISSLTVLLPLHHLPNQLHQTQCLFFVFFVSFASLYLTFSNGSVDSLILLWSFSALKSSHPLLREGG